MLPSRQMECPLQVAQAPPTYRFLASRLLMYTVLRWTGHFKRYQRDCTVCLYAGTLQPGCEILLEVSITSDCNSSTYLHVELWDMGQLLLKTPIPAESRLRADPLLGMAQGMAPTAIYKGPSSWDIQPPQALFDTQGYELTGHYMQVQVSPRPPSHSCVITTPRLHQVIQIVSHTSPVSPGQAASLSAVTAKVHLQMLLMQ